jgi:hypothetical protein
MNCVIRCVFLIAMVATGALAQSGGYDPCQNPSPPPNCPPPKKLPPVGSYYACSACSHEHLLCYRDTPDTFVCRTGDKHLGTKVPACAGKFSASRTISNAQQLAAAIFEQYSKYPNCPIGIAQVTSPGGLRGTYLVLLSGTQFELHQSNNLWTDILSSPGLVNEYFAGIQDALYTYVPRNATLIIAGHSLGGMEAQNVAANATIRKFYRIARVITYGSPQTVQQVPPTKYVRFATQPDPVPLLALGTFTNGTQAYWIKNPNQSRDAWQGIVGAINAHLSYPTLAGLAYFDALGNLCGGAGARGCIQLGLGPDRHVDAPGLVLP